MFYNNYKWNITFKNCESLCCTFETYNIVHQLYFNKTRKGEKHEMDDLSLHHVRTHQEDSQEVCAHQALGKNPRLEGLAGLKSEFQSLICHVGLL